MKSYLRQRKGIYTKMATKKISVTPEMQKELANLARAANRRLERATSGQRGALDYYLRGYHTREGAHGTVFQQGKAKTEREYRARMEELRRFMAGDTTTRRGWEALKEENIERAQETIKRQGYELSDEEFATILKETGGHRSIQFYRALDIVQAEKNKKGELSADEVRAAISSRSSAYESTLAAIKSRGE